MKCYDINELLKYMKSIQNDTQIYLWGCGYYGTKLGKILNSQNLIWHGYYDNYEVVKSKTLNNKPVISSEDICINEKMIYCIGTREIHANNIRQQLLASGVRENNIISLEGTDIFRQIEELSSEENSVVMGMKKFQNLHKGQKCFIIGNGPSLKLDDLEKIADEGIVSFGSNYIFKCYDKTYWRPDYYVVMDTAAVRTFLFDKDLASQIFQNSKQVFAYNYGDLDSIEIVNLVRFNYNCSNEIGMFSSDCAKQIYTGKTVTYVMLQLAVYMGFSEIYLLGMDHTFSTEIKKDGTLIHNNIEDHSKVLDCGKVAYFHIDEATKAYMSAKQYADEHGIKIYNATRGGKLEIFERVNFNKVFI